MIRKFANWLLKKTCHPEYVRDIRGDLEELHWTNQNKYSRFKSEWLYLKEVILLLRWPLLKEWTLLQGLRNYPLLAMNYLVVARRNMWKSRGFSFLNIAGLALGITVFLLTYLYVTDEMSYDQWHPDHERIFRVTHAEAVNDIVRYRNGTTYPAAAALKAEYPQVEQVARLIGHSDYLGLPLISYDEKSFLLEELSWTDPEITEILGLDFIQGNPRTCLNELRSLVITRSMAERLFGEANALGNEVRFNLDRDNDPEGMMEPYTMTITGVIEDLPENGHQQFEVLGNIRFSNWEFWSADNWYSNHYPTYIKLNKGVDPAEMENALERFVDNHMDEDIRSRLQLYLQPITNIRLSSLPGDPEPNSQRKVIDTLSIIALLILILACINYMNLSTARFTRRSKEVGLRKVIGAQKGQLVAQFLLESTLTTFLAVILSLGMVYLLLPFFNLLMDKTLVMQFDSRFIQVLAGVIFVLGALSGTYPAFFMASFKPGTILKTAGHQGKSTALIRKCLVTFQFTITISLLIGIGTIYYQMTYMQDLELDIKKEDYVFLRSKEEVFSNLETFERFKQTLVKHPAIDAASGSWSLPFGVNAPVFFYPFLPEGFASDERFHMHLFRADHEFLETFNAELRAGRNFSREFPNDPRQAFILNEKAVKALGWDNESAVGKSLEVFSGGGNSFKTGKVIGVVKDFNFHSLHNAVKPLAISMVNEEQYRYVAMKINPADLQNTVAYIEETWSAFVPGWPPELFFMEEEWRKNYEHEQQLAESLKYLTIIGLVIACLGLFGLSSYTAEQKQKEIGIRKVLGSSVYAIIQLLTAQFTWLIVIAFFVAAPLGYYYSEQWLSQFAYRIGTVWWVYLAVMVTALVITSLTVVYQSVKAALANPVEVLRNE